MCTFRYKSSKGFPKGRFKVDSLAIKSSYEFLSYTCIPGVYIK